MQTSSASSATSLLHPRTVGWFGTTAVAMGGINQSLFLIGALFIGQGAIPGQGSAAVVLLAVGLLLSWAATPGWTELILMYPNRVGGIAATCAEAFRPYSPVLANLTGVCYWWGWVPTCGLTATLASTALVHWCLPAMPDYAPRVLASGIVILFAAVNLCGVKWVMRLAMPVATAAAALAFCSAILPITSGSVDWQQAFSFHLTVPFPGWFGQVTSVMAGLYLIGFAAPAFEQATSHVGETIDPNRNVPRAVFASAGLASLYFIILPVIWLGTLGPEELGKDLANVLGPTFAPLFGASAKAAAVWFMIFNMLHGCLAPLAGAARTLAQLAEDGLLPESLAKRSKTDAPWVATISTGLMAIVFLWIGNPIWMIAAANLTYLIGISLPSVAVWLLRRNEPTLERPYRAPRGTIWLGLLAAGAWGLTAVLGFEQFGLTTVLIGITFAYSGAALYAWRKFMDRRKAGLPGIARTLHLKLTGAMLLVLVLDAGGYLIAVGSVPTQNSALITILEDIFVVVALLTIAVGLILPGMIAHSAVEVSKAANLLVAGTLKDFTKAMQALAAGDLDGAHAKFHTMPVKVYSRDEVGDMAVNFNRLQVEVGRAAEGLVGAREGLHQSRQSLTGTNKQLTEELAGRLRAELELQTLVRDKVALLKEVHHRVKNNLQFIYSLLRLETGRSDNLETKLAMQDMQGRIRSMSLLHELLYRSGTFAKVDLGDYLNKLATESFRSLVDSSSKVKLHLDVCAVDAPMDQAISCGLFMNELLSNCLKHAFPNDRPGEVQITLQMGKNPNEFQIGVRDNGIGLPADFDEKRGNSLGHQLVSDLAHQIGGTMVIETGPGAAFSLIFSVETSLLPIEN
ncbi:MAG: amino acid permease [Akkermansiaceae bacterium]|nr:amino acid permease [Akkermansiaceae bacterium]